MQWFFLETEAIMSKLFAYLGVRLLLSLACTWILWSEKHTVDRGHELTDSPKWTAIGEYESLRDCQSGLGRQLEMLYAEEESSRSPYTTLSRTSGERRSDWDGVSIYTKTPIDEHLT